jgi:hypothetical protein
MERAIALIETIYQRLYKACVMLLIQLPDRMGYKVRGLEQSGFTRAREIRNVCQVANCAPSCAVPMKLTNP